VGNRVLSALAYVTRKIRSGLSTLFFEECTADDALLVIVVGVDTSAVVDCTGDDALVVVVGLNTSAGLDTSAPVVVAYLFGFEIRRKVNPRCFTISRFDMLMIELK
jgi:hypothetical protein